MSRRRQGLSRRSALAAVAGGVFAVHAATRPRGAEPAVRIDRLAIGNYGMKSLPLEQAIAAVAEIGFGGFECCAAPEWDSEPERMPPERRKAVAALLAEKRLRLSAVMENIPLSADDAAHAKGLARMAAAIDLGRDLAPARRPLVQTVLGGGKWENVRGMFRDRLGAWVELARERQATIGIKPHRFGAMSTPAQAAALCGELGDPPELRIVYDASHYVFRDLPTEQTIRDARGLIGYVAVKDAVQTGEKVSFALPGTAGTPDHAAIRRALDAAGYAGEYCCEVSGLVWQQPGYDPIAAARTCHAKLAGIFG